MKTHSLFKLHFLSVGETVEEKRAWFLREGRAMASSEEIFEILLHKPYLIIHQKIVIVDARHEPPRGVFRMVPAYGRCKGVLPHGVFLNGAIDYSIPLWPASAETVCFLELVS